VAVRCRRRSLCLRCYDNGLPQQCMIGDPFSGAMHQRGSICRSNATTGNHRPEQCIISAAVHHRGPTFRSNASSGTHFPQQCINEGAHLPQQCTIGDPFSAAMQQQGPISRSNATSGTHLPQQCIIGGPHFTAMHHRAPIFRNKRAQSRRCAGSAFFSCCFVSLKLISTPGSLTLRHYDLLFMIYNFVSPR
jgi:hypothetical protein